ncbi:hypothetical protein TRFO_20035 [Tritrichomonas foetus]|uniref:PAS domain-containing protein n=1 Tax=Tritrichomonas foetus TaxID=1144522 RepID=A0A1J4KHZ3_9EUKA|nr:hypothetical protein TRFO_20035 [Tritrichomonas foetus]|eukprot:OHT10552.1 hypothetical protein TRFO_20035 [Tritrichomonas foetus]
MNLGEEEDTQDTYISLETLMDYFEINKRNSSKNKINQFEHFNQILFFTRLPKSVDAFLWIFFFLFIEFIVTISSIHSNWFQRFYSRDGLTSVNVTKYLFSKISVQMSTIVCFGITYLILGFHRNNSFGKKMKLSVFKATLLHVSFVHIPLILVPFYGIIYGIHTMSNYLRVTQDNSGTFYSLLIATMFILIVVSTLTFANTTYTKLTINKLYFEFWNYPYNLIDFVFLFILGAFMPMYDYNDHGENLSIMMSFFLIIYGSYKLFQRKIPAFVRIIPHFIESKVFLDMIVFGVFQVVTYFVPLGNTVEVLMISILHFFTFILGILFFTSNRILNTKVLNRYTMTIDKNFIHSPADALSILRSGITLSFPCVSDPNFLKWIAMWRFSPPLIADLFRLCIILDRPFKEILIANDTFGSADTSQLQFLIFQVSFYMNLHQMSSKSHDETLQKLQQKATKLQLMCDNFWTVHDYDQSTINKLGNKIIDILNDFKLGVMHFVNSKQIIDLYSDFLSTTFKSPNMMKIEQISKNPYRYLESPKGTIFGFLDDPTKERSPPVHDSFLTTDEKLALDTASNGSKPLLYFFRILLVLFFIITIAFWVFYYLHVKTIWEHFAIISELQQSAVTLATNILLPIDAAVSFPSPSTIQQIIGIPIELARQYRQPMYLPLSFKRELETAPVYIEQQRPIFPIPNVSCNSISFSTLIHMNNSNEETTNINHRRCLLMNELAYMDQIYNRSELELKSFQKMENQSLYPINYFVTCYLIATVIGFIGVFLKVRINHSKLLDSVRLVKSMNPNYKEHEFLDFQFWVLPTFAIFACVVICQVGIIVSYIVPITWSCTFVSEIMNETSKLSMITSSIQMAMALAEYSLVDQQFYAEYMDMVYDKCMVVYENTIFLAQSGFSSSFVDVKPLYQWSLPNRDSFNTVLLDICRYLLSTNHTVETFDFLAGRAFFIFNVSTIINYTLPEVFNRSHNAIRFEVSMFWWITILIVLIQIFLHLFYKSVIYNKQKIWFMTASVICLRENQGNLKSILDRENVYLPDLIPFPFIVKNKDNDIITYANSSTSKYTDLSINQLIGQPFNKVWKVHHKKIIYENRTVKIKEKEIDDNYTMVTFDDITKESEIEEKYNNLLKSSRIESLNLPAEIEMFFIDIRLNGDLIPDVELVFQWFNVAEKVCPKFQRIACGITFYNVVVSSVVSFGKVLKFLTKFYELIENPNLSKIAVVSGKGKIISLAGNNAVSVLCGKIYKRAHDCVLNGSWGKIYIDYNALEEVKSEKYEHLNEHIIPISDVVHENE